MLSVDNFSRTPVYQQILDGIRKEIALGLKGPGAQLTSVRELSAALGINPNTVQKAYLELERQGLIVSVPGKGSFVSPDAGTQTQAFLIQEEKSRIRESIERLIGIGLDKASLNAWIDEIYETHKGGKKE